MEVDGRSNKSPPENIEEIRTPPPKVQHENPWPDLRTMAESPGAGVPRSAPITEVLCPENLQYVQVEDIQALIMILQYLIPPRGDPTKAKISHLSHKRMTFSHHQLPEMQQSRNDQYWKKGVTSDHPCPNLFTPSFQGGQR